MVIVMLAESFVFLLEAYLAIGALLALAFVTKGIGQVDPVAKGASAGARLILFPGAVALWPLVLNLWMRASRNH
jgi:hypothetical protein